MHADSYLDSSGMFQMDWWSTGTCSFLAKNQYSYKTVSIYILYLHLHIYIYIYVHFVYITIISQIVTFRLFSEGNIPFLFFFNEEEQISVENPWNFEVNVDRLDVEERLGLKVRYGSWGPVMDMLSQPSRFIKPLFLKGDYVRGGVGWPAMILVGMKPFGR